MSYSSTSIKSIIKKLNSSYFIPDIQRSYVWLQNPKSRKIEQLFDSLMRGYPIGTFLFWELNKQDIDTDFNNDNDSGKLNFQLYKFIENYDSRKNNNEKINVSQIHNDELHIVLDGQQRLTSLYLGLCGTICIKRAYARNGTPNQYETKRLYLNVLYSPDNNNPEDGYQFVFKTNDEARNKNEREWWFPVSETLNFNNREDIRTYCNKNNLHDKPNFMIEDLWSAINKEDTISYFNETEKKLDKVLKIFIRVNSGGMQLSYSDLLMSLLTATFKSEIRDKMEEVVQRMKEDGFDCFGRDQILKTCMLLSGCNHVFKLENFNKKNIKIFEENWDTTIKYLYFTTNFLKSIGYSHHLSSGYIISAICLYLFKKQINKINNDDRKAITMFVQVAQMRSYFSTSLDAKLTHLKDIINEVDNFTTLITKMHQQPDFGIDNKYIEWAIENIKYGSPSALPILQLLYPNLDYGNIMFHIDHIYPKSKFNKKNKELPSEFIGRENELWNLQLLKGIANQEKKDKDPKEWLANEIKDSEELKEYLKSNYIEENFNFEWNAISEFEKNRKDKIIKKLKCIFNTEEINAN